MQTSTAIQLLTTVWSFGKKDSWGRINNSMRNALELAIGSGLTFDDPDFDYMAGKFNAYSWWNSSTEWIYSRAIVYGNESCVTAYEAWVGRQPFRANKVSADGWLCRDGYVHLNSINRERSRVGVGMHFEWVGLKFTVTSFNDPKNIIRAVAERKTGGKLLEKWTVDEFAEAFPAKKKAKKNEPATQTA